MHNQAMVEHIICKLKWCTYTWTGASSVWNLKSIYREDTHKTRHPQLLVELSNIFVKIVGMLLNCCRVGQPCLNPKASSLLITSINFPVCKNYVLDSAINFASCFTSPCNSVSETLLSILPSTFQAPSKK